jgi:hypothetical protein
MQCPGSRSLQNNDNFNQAKVGCSDAKYNVSDPINVFIGWYK